MSGWWRIDDDDRFVREGPGAWVYGPADPHLAGLRVPGARDVTRGEVVPPEIEPKRRAPGYVFFRESVVAHRPELSWLNGRPRLPRPRVGGYLGVPLEEWEPREGEVVGMRAPELGDGYERVLALAERDVRAWRRAKTQAARLRAALVRRARDELVVPGADVARWIGVSRNRIQQICEEPTG